MKNGGLEKLFKMNEDIKPEAVKKAEKGIEEKEIASILGATDTSLPMPLSGKVDVTIDAKKAAKLNEFIQVRLAKIYEHAESAASTLVESITAGDVDARSIEGTARLLETSIRALSEMNQFNMFLQKKMGDEGIRMEMEKLQSQMRDGRTVMNREEIMKLAVEIDRHKEEKEPKDNGKNSEGS